MPATRGNRVNVFFDADMDEDSDYVTQKKTVNGKIDDFHLVNTERSISLVAALLLEMLRKLSQMELALDDSSEVIDITCGVLQAKLHRQRFICPGINRDCIEYDGRLLTPKTFYILADKGSLKDWKNAIRINGKKIRRYIESGTLDFYNHKELCTGRCKSRLGNKSSVLPMDHVPTLASNSLADSMNKEPSTNVDSGFNSSNESIVTDSFGEPKDVKPTAEQLNMIMLQGTSLLENNSQLAPGLLENKGILPVGLLSLKPLEGIELEDEDQMFWRAIVQLGLIDEFFREIKSKLDVLKVSMIKNFVSLQDAKKASMIVEELGMKAKLDLRLSAHKFEFDRQRDKLEREMEQLKKKVSEYEQKKEILKRKSDCYEHLMAKKKTDDVSQNSFTFETSSGTAMILNARDNSDAEDRSRSNSPLTINPGQISIIQKHQDILLSKKRKGEFGVEIPTKYTIETPHGATTVLVSQDIDSEGYRAMSPSPSASQDSSAISPSPGPTTSQDESTISPSQDSSSETLGDSLSQDTNSSV